jgi:hypothetical protein
LGLEAILNEALARTRKAPPGQIDSSVGSGEFEVRAFAMSPVSLSLLGVVAHLDNGANGPVQVSFSATAEEGWVRKSSKRWRAAPSLPFRIFCASWGAR